MSEESERLHMLRWFRARWVLPVLNVLMVGAFVVLFVAHAQESSQLDAIQISQAVAQAFDQTQINTNTKNAQAALAFDGVLAHFFAEENFICEELVAHNKVLGGPTPPPGICDVQLPKS